MDNIDLKERSRNWNILLYPEDETHKKAIEEINNKYSYAAILHDKDVDEDGVIKKEHWHCVLKLPNARTRKSVADSLGIAYNYLDKSEDLNKSLEYLVHLNNPEKYQYESSEVFGNLANRVRELVNNCNKTEGEKVIEIFNYIDSKKGVISVRSLARWSAESGYWSEFRRSQTLMLAYLQEHNRQYEQ